MSPRNRAQSLFEDSKETAQVSPGHKDNSPMASDNTATMGQTMVALEPQTCEASDNAISEQKDADRHKISTGTFVCCIPWEDDGGCFVCCIPWEDDGG